MFSFIDRSAYSFPSTQKRKAKKKGNYVWLDSTYKCQLISASIAYTIYSTKEITHFVAPVIIILNLCRSPFLACSCHIHSHIHTGGGNSYHINCAGENEEKKKMRALNYQLHKMQYLPNPKSNENENTFAVRWQQYRFVHIKSGKQCEKMRVLLSDLFLVQWLSVKCDCTVKSFSFISRFF